MKQLSQKQRVKAVLKLASGKKDIAISLMKQQIESFKYAAEMCDIPGFRDPSTRKWNEAQARLVEDDMKYLMEKYK